MRISCFLYSTPHTTLDAIDIEDVWRVVVAAASASPTRLPEQEIPLVAESLTRGEMAAPVKQGNWTVAALTLRRDLGYGADVEDLKQHGAPLTPMLKTFEWDMLICC